MRNGAQVALNVTGEIHHGAGVGGVEPTNANWNAVGKGTKEQEYNLERVRGIGGLAMGQTLANGLEMDQAPMSVSGAGQVLTYNPDLQEADLGTVGPKGPDAAGNWYQAVQGRDASEMKGVAGESLQQLEHPSEQMRMQNERVREQAEIENGFARNEIDPNLSSVGLASETEEVYREAMDKGNEEAEFKPESFDDKLQNKSQEEMGKVVATIVGKLRGRKSFAPAQIARLRDEWMEKMLAAFKNPRKFKERNG